tara:strand:+ start:53791 stop:53943 length:153 start_codon:yes stop_codon:yes gene_type:complete
MSFECTPPTYTHTFSDGQSVTLLPINVDNLPALIERNAESGAIKTILGIK